MGIDSDRTRRPVVRREHQKRLPAKVIIAPMAEITAPAPIGAPPAEASGPPTRLDFDIVPRKGLMVVAIALVALVVAIAVNKLWPLEFMHVAVGAAWTIIDLFLGLVLGPILGKHVDPRAGRVHDQADAEDGR